MAKKTTKKAAQKASKPKPAEPVAESPKVEPKPEPKPTKPRAPSKAVLLESELKVVKATADEFARMLADVAAREMTYRRDIEAKLREHGYARLVDGSKS